MMELADETESIVDEVIIALELEEAIDVIVAVKDEQGEDEAEVWIAYVWLDEIKPETLREGRVVKLVEAGRFEELVY